MILVENKAKQMRYKIAVVQLAAATTIEEQWSKIESYLFQAQQEEVQLVILPEEFLTLHLDSIEKCALKEEYLKGKFQNKLQTLAQQYNLWIVAGTLPIKSPHPNKFYASCLLIDPQGEIRARYDKIHLFDVEVAEGKEAYRESDYIFPGNQIITFELPFAHIGIAICYDLRFPELFRSMIQKGVDLFVLPSAFTIRTGERHWETLIKARAIENLSYVAACNHVGIRKNGEGTYGHSMIVGPWGDSLGALTMEEGLLIQTIDKEPLIHLRQRFPALSHCQPFVMNALNSKA